MATRTVKAVGGSWGLKATWVEGAIPTSADDVVCDASSGNLVTYASGTTGIDVVCKSINFTGYAGTFHQTHNLTVYGNCTLATGMTYTTGATSRIVFSGTGTLISAGKTLCFLRINGAGITVTQSDNLAITNSLILLKGTYDANDYNISMKYFAGSDNGADIRVLRMGNGIWTVTGRDSNNRAWNFSLYSTATVYCEGSTLVFANTDNVITAFYPGVKFVYKNITINSNTGTSALFNIDQSFTCYDLLIHAKRTVQLKALITVTITNSFVCDTAIDNFVTLKSITAGSKWYIVANNPVTCNYISLKDSSASGTTFKAGGSTNVSGNSGWLFVVVDTSSVVDIQSFTYIIAREAGESAPVICVFPSENNIGGGKEITEKYLAMLISAMCRNVNGFVVSGLAGPPLTPNPGLVFTIAPGTAIIMGRFVEVQGATIFNLTAGQSYHYITLGITISSNNVISVQFGYTNSTVVPTNAIRLYKVVTTNNLLNSYTDYRPKLNNIISVPVL